MLYEVYNTDECMDVEKPVGERKGKSWKREREERGRRAKDGEKKDEEDSSKQELFEDNSVDNDDKSVELVDVLDTESNSNDEEQKEIENKKFFEDYLAETNARLTGKRELRAVNLLAPHKRPEETHFSKLDSSLKKNTAFVRRLKNMTDAQKDSIIRDMLTLNLSKYISEVAAAIVDAKLKLSDISAAIQICSFLHQNYAEFAHYLLDYWQKVFSFKKEEKISNPSKLRVDLRLYAELVSTGVFTPKEGLPLLGNVLTTLVNMDKEEHNNVSILLSFCKHCGEDYAGLVPRRVRCLSEKYGIPVSKSDLLTNEKQRNVRSLLKDYFTSLCKHLLKDHKELKSYDRQNKRILRTKGELAQERQDKQESLNISFQKLIANAQQLSEILDEDLPSLPVEEVDEDEEMNISLKFVDGEYLSGDKSDAYSFWEDEDAKSFYENLPDLKAIIPSILYKDSASSALQNDKIENEEVIEADSECDQEIQIEGDNESDIEDIDKEENLDLSEKAEEEPEPLEIEDEIDEVDSSTNSANKILLDTFLNSLPNCVNRELIDAAAEKFCTTLNTKPNRRKLVRALLLVPRTRLDLLPFYSRLIATLNPCMPDVASDLCQSLKQDFRYQVRKKDQINIESKIKVCRFIGELVKFRLFLKNDVLQCLKLLLFDFSHHHIEMACNLLETCGRFLFRSPDSHQRTKICLDQMMRKKSVKAMDTRYTTMIENAYYYCNPPDLPPQSSKKERPPLHEYIRKLLYKDLCKNNTEKILRSIRKLNWEDPDLSAYVVKCLMSVWNVKYFNIRYLASLLAGLVSYQEAVGLQVVDGVLEDIRLGMEVNISKFKQRRVSCIRYLGELYNYRMVESSVIFKVLCSLITFGVNIDGQYSELDPPEQLFRIHLVCVLLDTCGQYFNSGSSKRNLDCFFVYLQRYYWMKKSQPFFTEDHHFPVTVDYAVRDTISNLRPKLKLYSSFEEAVKAVEALEAEFLPKMRQYIHLGQDREDGGNLTPIRETEEDELESAEVSYSVEFDGEESSQPIDLTGWTQEESLSQSQHSQPLNDDLDHYQDMTQNDEHDDDNDMGQDSNGLMDMDGRETVHVSNALSSQACPEDEDFMAAFDKMMYDNIQDRGREIMKPSHVDISVPFHFRSNSKKSYDQLQEPELPCDATVKFYLMTRRGNKQQYRSLAVPRESELAQNLRNREEAEKLEKEHIKKVTLDINERQEEEDYQEMLAQAQRPALVNLNRDRRQKYQHPKGAPDADLIFGPKKIR